MKPHTFQCQLVLILILFSSCLFGQESINYQKLKLQEAINIALNHNKGLQMQSLKTDVSKLNERDLKNEKLPDINFKSSFHVLSNLNQYENGLGHSSTTYEVPRWKYNFTLDAEIPIYTGGKLKYEDEKAEVSIEIESLKFRKQEKEVKMQLISAYLQVLHFEEQKKLIQEKMHEDSLVIRQAEKLKQNGAVTYNDVLRTKLQLSNHQMAFSEIEKEINILEDQIMTILGIGTEENIHVCTTDLIGKDHEPKLFDDLLNIAFEKNESLDIVLKDLEIKELDKRITHSNVLPKISAGAEYGYNYPNFIFFPPEAHLYRFGSAGINLKIPLANFYKNKVKMRIAQRNIDIGNLAVQEKKEELRHDVFTAQQRLEESYNKVKIAKEAIEQAKENYRIVKVKYANQLSLITELIDADNAFLEAQSNLISLQINTHLKYYQLQYVLGNI